MKKFAALLVVIAIVAMAAAFAGAFFANAMFAKNAQMVVAEATATPSANVVVQDPEPTIVPTVEPTAAPEPTIASTFEPTAAPETTVEPTATPIAEVISEDPSQISLGNFLTMSRSSDGSFNATPVGSQDGWVEFTDKDLMSHVGGQITVNVASQSLSVKLENKSHIYRSADVGQADFSVCPQHRALYRRHTSAYGDDIVVTLTAEDITNIAQYAAYWYNSDGELTYGLTICDCLVGKHSDTSSNGSNSGHHPSDEPTPVPTQKPQPTAEPTNEPTAVPTEKPAETPHPAESNTPQPPKDEATNNPGHNDQVEPQPAVNNTPQAPEEEASNQPAHNDVANSNAGAGADESNNSPSHSNLPGAEEASESTASAVADAGSAPAAPSEDLVASIASNDAPPAPAEDMIASISSRAEESEESSSTPEIPATVVEVATNVSNITAHDDMPTE